MGELNRKLVWLMAIRLLVLASLIMHSLLYLPLDGESSWLLSVERWFESLRAERAIDLVGPPAEDERGATVMQVVVAIVSLQTLLYALLMRLLARRPERHAWIQLLGDLLLVSLVVYKFGGATANAVILYLVIIAVASFLMRGRAGLVTAVVAAALSTVVISLQHSEAFRGLWLEPSMLRELGAPFRGVVDWLEPPSGDELTGVPLAYKLLVPPIAFFSVGAFTTYLARDQALERKLRQKQHDLDYLQVLHRDVVESISSGLIVTDLEGQINSLNRAAREILDFDESIVGESILDTELFDRESWLRHTHQSGLGMIRAEVQLRRGAETLFIGFSLSHLRDADGQLRGYILVFQDLTEWRQLQEQVQIHDRMAALGQMAAGLAHEVGNPLAAITGTAQMLEPHARSEKMAKLLGIMRKESGRLDRTVKSFLQFAKPADHHPEPFDIAAHLAEDVELLRHSNEVQPSHEIVVQIDPPSATIVADVDQISQVFWNLARNSLRSMPDGGRLELSGRLLAERYEIEFRDTGVGMGERERAELFQPFKSFFDSGLGLGMAIVYRIVQEHRGEILVDSEPTRGTSIKIELPLRREEAS
ncbi:MAG: ATP-binding protein [Acidobacteriota bacterium]